LGREGKWGKGKSCQNAGKKKGVRNGVGKEGGEDTVWWKKMEKKKPGETGVGAD